MKITMLQGKIHRATVTQAEKDYIGSITVEDSRELFYLVLDWAEEFEKQFDPETQDYLTEMESFGRRKLLGTYQADPQLGR